ncbi:Hypothetical predicted protein [Lecanosticta acicola]|uniref:Rhodopsin domain-containing protein n=1 Tax=Lecanosticta acicola TaxID=111012 RepID=A0AAI8YSA5_9PEZI|nr:Hypothetical predicted protein [Lecanosticta acicola]
MSSPSVSPDTPLAPAPPGFTTDFSDEGYAPTLRGLIIALLVLNTIFTVARVYTRAGPLRSFGIDDGFVIAAWISTTVHMAVTLDALAHGFGHHLWNIRVSGYAHLYRDFFVLEVWSTVVYCSLKLAFLFTYERIFSPTKVYRYLIWGGITVCFLFYFGSFWWLIFKCSPIAASWDPFITNYTCAKEFVSGGETGVFNVISDVYILFLPIPMIWNLQTNTKRKLRLLAVFSVGLFTAVTSIVRLAETVIQAKNPDAFYALGKVDIWALLEYSIGLMVVCSLVFTALWNKVLVGPATKIWNSLSSAAKSVLTLRSQNHTSQNSATEMSMSQEHFSAARAESERTAGQKKTSHDSSSFVTDEGRMV